MKNDKTQNLKVSITAGLIVAAGMSSRMKEFKPLLKLGEKTIIDHVVDTLIDGGVQELVVVTGKNAKDIENQLKSKKVNFIYNACYEKSTMFDSAKLGMKYLQGKCNQFFFLPGDVPLFKSHSIKVMQETMHQKNCSMVQPVYNGEQGHPVLLSAECIEPILNHNGTNGMKGAIEAFIDDKIELSLPDKGMLLDADTPDDYQSLKKYYGKLYAPDFETCMEILRFYRTDDAIVRHCVAVADVATETALKLIDLGHSIDIKLVQAGALLHDVAKKEKNHPLQGSKWMRELGYAEVADIIGEHMDISAEAIEKMDERAIVYLADKLVIEDKKVSLEDRLEKTLMRYANNQEAKKNAVIRLNKANEILRNIHALEGKR